ncbi:cytochrome P450 [bacterium]|nr:cytochrome P450 [bacterium]
MRHSTVAPPPGPRLVSAFGNLRSFQERPLKFLLDLDVKYGGVVRFPTGFLPVYLVADPNAVKHILLDNYQNYSKNTFTYGMARRILGNNLLTSDGTEWLKRRRMLQPLFHRQNLSRLVIDMAEITNEMLEQWQAAQYPLDLIGEMMRITLRIAGKTLFDTELDAESAAVRDALNTTTDEVFNQFRSPMAALWTMLDFPTPWNRRFGQAQRRLDELLFRIIRERRSSPTGSFDMLSMLVDAVDQGDEQGFDDVMIRNEIGTMLTAGHETTALALTWTWLLLSANPDVEQRLQAEIDGQSAQPTGIDLVKQLPYTAAVLAEVLRLYPPVWGFSRRAIKDDTINGYHIPSGARVMLSPWVTQHSPRYWSEPERFDPLRFFEGTEADGKSTAYFPFGMGPRVCIGNRFATMEALLILFLTLRRYRVEITSEYPIEVSTQGTLRPQHPVRFQLVVR